MEIVTSFIIGFISMWFLSKTSPYISKQTCPMKNTMLNIASNYGTNEKTREIWSVCKKVITNLISICDKILSRIIDFILSYPR